ncbi:DUF6090 family protein [Spongiimicrobium salis]|uniref:DUF6090 family protein n=1 Tax=Spongiimicrobium salis TaxID=1667022 RepID=UPI00374CE121
MIKFFRKIRQNLLSEGKTGTYLKYAIGEIVLVVIGILIALQINNWKENSKEKDLEQSYYCLLLDDIKQDKLQVNTLKKLVSERITYSNKAISEIQKENSDATEVGVNYRLSIRLGSRTFQPNDATFQDIKSSGNLGIISDKILLKRLNSYFRNVDGYSATILTNANFDFEKVSSFKSLFDIGLFNSNDYFYNTIFTKEIRANIQKDLPQYIPKHIKPELYSTVVMVGLNNQRRLELLKLIENEIDKVYKIIAKKCTSNT